MTERDERLQVLLDRAEIQDLMARYARGVNRRDWDLVRSCYHEDAFDDHGSFQGDVEGFVNWVAERHAGIEQSMHFLGNSLIDVQGDVAFGETYVTTFQHETRPGQPTQYTHTGCRYVDRFERRGNGPWKYSHRHLILEFAHVSEQPTGWDMFAEHELAQRSPDDLVYRIRREPAIDQ